MAVLKAWRQVFLLFMLTLASIQTVWANKAGIVIFPTRAVLDESEKSVQITLINKGTATGSYQISLVDMEMQESGKIKRYEGDEPMATSLIPFTRFSPRRTTLGPDESQKIKVLIRKKGKLPDGEYRSHLRVYMVEDNVEAAEKSATDQVEQDKVTFSLKQRTAFVIPIIWRKGDTKAEFKIDNFSFDKENNQALFDVYREGNQSQLGDFFVTHIPDGGEPKLIGDAKGLAIYHPTPMRKVKAKLFKDVALPLAKGTIVVTFNKRKDAGGDLLADFETTVP